MFLLCSLFISCSSSVSSFLYSPSLSLFSCCPWSLPQPSYSVSLPSFSALHICLSPLSLQVSIWTSAGICHGYNTFINSRISTFSQTVVITFDYVGKKSRSSAAQRWQLQRPQTSGKSPTSPEVKYVSDYHPHRMTQCKPILSLMSFCIIA